MPHAVPGRSSRRYRRRGDRSRDATHRVRYRRGKPTSADAADGRLTHPERPATGQLQGRVLDVLHADPAGTRLLLHSRRQERTTGAALIRATAPNDAARADVTAPDAARTDLGPCPDTVAHAWRR